MNFFNFLLMLELRIVSLNPIYFSLTSIFFSSILIILLWYQNINIFICIFIGFLILWERYLIFKIKKAGFKL